MSLISNLKKLTDKDLLKIYRDLGLNNPMVNPMDSEDLSTYWELVIGSEEEILKRMSNGNEKKDCVEEG